MGNKPLYMISVVSEMLSIHPQTIRQYEKLGLLKPSRTDGNIRRYSDADVSKLQFIIHLTKELGVNLAGVEIILSMQEEVSKLEIKLDTLQKNMEKQTPQNTIKIKLKS